MLDGMLAPRSFGSSTVDPAYRVAITQQFPLFGQRGLRRRAARSEAEVAAYDFETARLDLLHDVRDVYFDYYRVCRSQEINRWLVELMSESRRVALARYSSGTVEQADPLQAETELAMLRTFASGALIGELSFFDGRPLGVLVRAVTDGEVVRVGVEELDEVARLRPELARAILLDLGRIVAGRLRHAQSSAKASLV